MGNKKDIGKAFREKLKDLDKAPDDKVWSAISADLQQKKKRRILIPFWWVAAGLVVVVGGILWMTLNHAADQKTGIPEQQRIDGVVNTAHEKHDSVTNKDVISEQDTEDRKKDPNTADSAIEANEMAGNPSEVISTERNANTKSQTSTANKSRLERRDKGNAEDYTQKYSASKRDAIAKGHKKGTANNVPPTAAAKGASAGDEKLSKMQPDSGLSQLEGGQNTESAIAVTPGNTAAGKSSDPAAAEKPTKSLTDSIKPVEQKQALKEKSKDSLPSKLQAQMKRLNIFVYASPTYGGFLSAKSPLDRSLDNNKRSSEIAVSYGGYAIYEVSDKWSMRFGIGIENLTFVTKDATVNTLDYGYISYTKGISNADIYMQTGNATKMDLTQKISYTEIPIEFKYVLRNQKVGINAYAGLSYRFLGKNEVSATTSNGAKFDIGETESLASNTFAVHFGIGLDYKFSRRVRLNVEPIFKYHLLDYKNARATPYSFGILTGFQFSLN